VTTSPDASRGSGLGPHVRGHLLLFERREPPAYDELRGLRLLFTAVFFEVVRVVLSRGGGESSAAVWLPPVLLALALIAVRFDTGLTLSQIGLRPWREWTPTERSYFVQVVVLANVVFPLVVGWPKLEVFVPYLFFGFYQELVYRGLLQLELSRRWGAVAGILVANALYTFGPLHARYFTSAPSTAIPMFAAIFAIGLLFGVIYRRSGNLGIPAVMHAIGNAYIVGSGRSF